MTYSVYLIHVFIIIISSSSQKTAYMYDDYNIFKDSIYYFVISYIFAVPFVLLIEMPALSLEKLAFYGDKKKTARVKEAKSEVKLKFNEESKD